MLKRLVTALAVVGVVLSSANLLPFSHLDSGMVFAQSSNETGAERNQRLRGELSTALQNLAEAERQNSGNSSQLKAQVEQLSNQLPPEDVQRVTNEAVAKIEADSKKRLEGLSSGGAIDAENAAAQRAANAVSGSTKGRLEKAIDDKFKALIESAKSKEKPISDAEKDCRATATCSDQQADIHKKEGEANKQYVEFLEAQRAYEKCKIDPKADCKTLKDTMDAKAATLRASLSTISNLERQVQQGARFQVSNIFNPDRKSDLNPDGETAQQALQQRQQTTFTGVVSTIADWMLQLVASLAVTALVIGGFMMVISGGDESRLETGKTIFIYSLIGLVISMLAYGIVAVIQSLFLGT